MCAAEPLAIALDVGGTSVKAGLVDRLGALHGEMRLFPIDADRDAETVLGQFEQVLRALWVDGVAGIGVGMPGPFNYVTGVCLMRAVAKYDALYGINLADDWRRRLGLAPDFPIRFANDAAAFGLGEARYGLGRGRRRVLAVTLGTGCGSAFVVDGRAVTEGGGVPPGGYIYCLPFRGATIDDWISRRGILRLWAEMAPGAPATDVADLAAAAWGGNSAAQALFARWGELLAEALGPVVKAFAPDVVILGGRISASLDLFGGPLRELTPAIASSNSAAGVLGAASLIWN